MAKVRFYCDVPEFRTDGYALCAWTRPLGSKMEGSTRVAFDVEMPPELWKAFDIPGPRVTAHIVAADDTKPDHG